MSLTTPLLSRHEGSDTKAAKQMLLLLLIGVFVVNADTSLVLATYGLISSEFHSLDKAGWLLTAYTLGMCSTQALYGKLSNIFGRKPVLMTAYVLFALGCLICGLAQNMTHLILGRVVGGIGGAGMHSVVSFLVVDLLPPREVASYRSYLNVVQTVGRSFGGPLGGFLAESIGWQWSFLCQVPLIGVSFLLVAWKLHPPEPASSTPHKKEDGYWTKLRRIDILGAILLATAVTTLLLPLSRLFAWPESSILLGVSALLFTGFAYTEAYIASEPIFPLHLLVKKDITIQYALVALQNTAQTIMMYCVPLYFQLTLSASPSKAGLYLVPSVIGNTIGGLAAGMYIRRTGRYKLPLVYSVIVAGGAYLLLTLRWRHPEYMILPLEALYTFPGGLGTGICHSATFVALTAALPDAGESAIATAGLFFVGSLGTLLGVTSAGSLVSGVMQLSASSKLTGRSDAEQIIQRALEDVEYIRGLPDLLRRLVKESYLDGLQGAFACSMALCAFSLMIALFIRETRL